METVFLEIANRSLSAGVLVLAVLLVRLVFRRMPKWALCLLWALVALRLVCPDLPQSSLSLQPTAQALPPEILYTAQPQIQSGLEIVDEAVNPVLTESLTPFPGASVNPTQVWSFLLSRAWAIGVGLMLFYLALSSVLLKRRMAASVPLEKGVRTGEMVETPFVFGLVRPTIYLPSGLEDAAMRSVLAHERSHIRRLDHLWKPLGYVLLSVYWFNPLMWLAYILLCRDIEAACDEKVIRELNQEERRVYSQALLQCSLGRRRIAACPLAFGEVGVKERIKGVMNYKKPGFWLILLALVLCAALAVGFLTDPNGMPLTEIDDSRNYSDLFTDPGDAALVRGGRRVRPWSVEEMLEDLEKIQVRPFSLLRTRSENRDKTHRIYLRGSTYVNFSAGYHRVWIDNGVKATYTYTVVNPGYVREVFEKYWQELPLTTWFLEDGAYEDQVITDVPGLKGYTFSYNGTHTGRQITAEMDGQSRVTIFGWPIHNVFFRDMTGDQVPEICATVSYGFGLIDSRIQVYDLTANKLLELESRGFCDYRLRAEDDRLMAEITSYATKESWGSGELCIDEGNGQLCLFSEGEDYHPPKAPEEDPDQEGALRLETSGQPFADISRPWSWCAGVTLNYVESARGSVTIDNSNTGAFLLVSALEELIPLLNDLSEEDFEKGDIIEKGYDDLTYFRDVGSVVAVTDPVNELTAVLRLDAGEVTMLLSREQDKFAWDRWSNLAPTQLWRVKDTNLTAWMESLILYKPFRYYSVAERWLWKEPFTAEVPGGYLHVELMEGWEYELCTDEPGGGIRIRPEGEEGWIRFGYWQGGYDGRVRDLEKHTGRGRFGDQEFERYKCYRTDESARNAIWAYELDELEGGDLVKINEGKDNWSGEREYEWVVIESQIRLVLQ